MTDRNQSSSQSHQSHFGQGPRQFMRNQVQEQGVSNQPAVHGTGFQGAPEMADIPPAAQRPDFYGGHPHGYMNMNPSVSQIPPPPRFQGGPMGPTLPVGSSLNGIVPPPSQELNQPWSHHGLGEGSLSQSIGSFHPQLSGNFMPANGSVTSVPGEGWPVVNGKMNAAPVGFQPVRPSQVNQLPSVSQGSLNYGSSPMLLSHACSTTVTGFAGTSSAPQLPSGSIGSQSTSVSNASGTSTPSSGLPKPASQKTSRDGSPVNLDDLEGQFPSASALQKEPTPPMMARPQPFTPGSQGPYVPAAPGQQSMALPLRPGVPNSATPPPPGTVPFGQQQMHAPPVPQYQETMSPTGPFRQPKPSAPPQAARGMLVGPPRSQQRASGPPSSLAGPPSSSVGGPPYSFAGLPMGSTSLAGPPQGPYGVGPPSSVAGPPRGPHGVGPPSSVAGPPPGPYGAGPPSSVAGPPPGPYGAGPPSSVAGLPPGPYGAGPPSSVAGPPPGPYGAGPPSSVAGPPSGHYGARPTPDVAGLPPGSGGPYYNTNFGGPPSGQVRPPPPGPPTAIQGSALGSGVNYPQPPTSQGMVRSTTGPPSGPQGPPSCPQGPPSGPGISQLQQQGYPPQPSGFTNNLAGDFNRLTVNEMQRVVNLMQEKNLIGPDGVETAEPVLFQATNRTNCCPDVFRCTLNAIPQNSALLNKSRLPLGILIHPFKDLSQLPVIQSSVIVRCRSCRTYINPFVTFVDQRRWKCNLCFRVNELPDEFSFDPVTKTYGDPQRRPEIRSPTIEFIAPSEYMLRPPQPAVYLFVLDVSFNAVETGYLRVFTQTLIEELDRLPGDSRTQVGFLCFDRALYFFNLSEGLSQPQMMVVPDLEEVFLPTPDNLLVNLHECRDMVVELLTQLPGLFEGNHETGNALGFALQAAFKLMSNTGGRMTVMQTTLPTVGPGALENREATSKAASLNSAYLGPSSDFYKKLALDCSAQQVAVDLFMLNGQYADIASVSCISKYSAGNVHYYPSFHTARNPAASDKFEADFRRYVTRKIGFESVMRIRCTRGVSIHTFHGNFFVRSADLLSLPNINPDAGFGMQMSIEDTLSESSNVCFQAALLYTSSKGERRIRVHTLCVPITSQLSEVFAGADQQAIAALLAKMAADRTQSSSLEDAREGLMNACQDMLSAYASQIPAAQRSGALLTPYSLRLLPMYSLAMLKSIAFRLSPNIKVDDRVYAHLASKNMPMSSLLQTYYPNLYPVHNLNDKDVVENSDDEKIPKAPVLQLNSGNLDRHGVYVMDQGDTIYLLVGASVPDIFCQEVLDVPDFQYIPEGLVELPEMDNPTSERIRCFINHLMDARPGGVTFLVVREDSRVRHRFFQHMVEDRTESSMSYYEFLQFLQQTVKG